MKPFVVSLLLIAMGFLAAYFGRDPSAWFAASMVVSALSPRSQE